MTRSSLQLTALALLQALGLWLLHDASMSDRWPADAPGILFSAYMVVLAAPLTCVLLWNHRAQRVLWAAVAALAIFLAWSGFVRFSALAPEAGGTLDENILPPMFAPWVLAWLLGLPMLRARLESGLWSAPYLALFQSAWRSALTLAEAAFFTAVFWALLSLWGVLFTLLGIDFFRELFSDPRFVYPATTLAFTAAIRIVAASDRLLDGALDALLDLLKWLAPLAGLIVIVFTLVLVPRLVDLFDSGERVIDSGVLLALVAANVLLLNAAYRDGSQEPSYPRALCEALRVVPPLLIIVALTALASLLIRVQAFGLTPARLWGLVTAVFALLHALGYSWAASVRTPWFAPLHRVNFGLAAALLATLIVSLTPLGDPLRWSVTAQQSRARAGASDAVRESALRYLRFDAGEPGRRALRALQTDAVVGVAASRVAAMTRDDRPAGMLDSQATLARYQRWRASLRTTDPTVPVALEPLLQQAFMRAATTLDPGGGAPPPLLVRVDLDADGREDYLLIAGAPRGVGLRDRDYRLFVQPTLDSGWRLASSGTLRGGGDGRVEMAEDLGSARPEPPRWQDLMLNGQRLSLRPIDP